MVYAHHNKSDSASEREIYMENKSTNDEKHNVRFLATGINPPVKEKKN